MTEVGLLSFALANRINWLKSENVKKQKEIIYQLKQNEEIQLEANRVLEQKVVERTAEVVEQKNEAVKQKKRSDELLLNILPEETAEELKVTGSAKAKHINQATVLFTDMKDFTQLSEKLTPEELVAEINDCFSEFDRILEKFGVEKIKTIGDSYMAAGGLPTPNTTHAKDVVNCALNILQFMQQLNDRKKAEGKISFDIRIGIHTGPVVAGIVGLKKFAYDIWGDTVNIASRMESSGEVGKINISKTTFDLVKDEFTCVYRGKVEAKNKGMIDMYFVEPGVKLEGVDGQQTRISYKH
jgi:class 3 adenylate cyclase